MWRAFGWWVKLEQSSESLQQLPKNWEKRLRVLVYASGSAELCRLVLRWRSENVSFFENNEEWWGLPTAVCGGVCGDAVCWPSSSLSRFGSNLIVLVWWWVCHIIMFIIITKKIQVNDFHRIALRDHSVIPLLKFKKWVVGVVTETY